MKDMGAARVKSWRAAIHAIVTILAFATMMASVGAGPALADDNDQHRGRGEGHRGRGENQRWERDRREWEQREYHHVYAPPPVIYAPPPVYDVPPPPPPGINFIFPLEIR